jgi:hypothetical protein
LQALREAGIDMTRVASIHGKVAKKERDQIAIGFNGQSRYEDPITGRVIQQAKKPIYDILIGNSKAMATGLNLQRRTGAIYHVNFTWEPATMEQREGRGVRQGNTEEAICVYHCIARQSFDSILLNTSQGKAEWQNEIFPGNAPAPFQSGDREEALIRLLVRDPLAAEKKFEDIRAKRRKAVELRWRTAAWRLWFVAYMNLRQIPREPLRGPQILAGVKYALDHGQPKAQENLTESVIKMLQRGKLLYPDIPRRMAYYYGGNRITQQGVDTTETRDVYILQAHVTDRMVTIFWREYGELRIKTTHIYRPGFIPPGTPAALVEERPDWSETPPFPDVLSVSPIPWSQREEGAGLRADLLTLFTACLDTRAQPKMDPVLAQIAWGNVQNREDLGWGQEIKSFTTPPLALELQAFCSIPEASPLRSLAQNKHSSVVSKPFLLLDDGSVCLVDIFPHAPNSYFTRPEKAVSIQRMLMPLHTQDLELVYEAIRTKTLKTLASGFPNGVGDFFALDLMGDRVQRLIWSLHIGWQVRVPKDLVQLLIVGANEQARKRYDEARRRGDSAGVPTPLTVAQIRSVVGPFALPISRGREAIEVSAEGK